MSIWEKRALNWTDQTIDTFRSALEYKVDHRTDDELRSILTYVSKEQGVDLIIKEMHHQIDVQLSIIRRQRDVIDAVNARYDNLLQLMSESIESDADLTTRDKPKAKKKSAAKGNDSNVIEFKKR
jgi:hypothetical protein